MRIGRFKVSQKLIRSKQIDQRYYLQVLFTSVFITRTKPLKESKEVEYHAICDQFDEINEEDDVPEYEVRIIKKENRVEFKRKVSANV